MTTPAVLPDITAHLPANGFVPDTNPEIDVPSDATLRIGVDVAAQLSGMTLPTGYSATLTDSSGTAVTLSEGPTLAWYTICQLVEGSLLTSGHGYRLTFTFQDNGASTYVAVIKIHCPF
jgi:hypothetical protein